MDCQDWIPVVARRRPNKKDAVAKGQLSIQTRDSNINERIRLAKVDSLDLPLVKKRINPDSLKQLIQKRIELKLTQDKADNLCSFPPHTFKNIECNRLIPSEEQKRNIHRNLGLQIKIDTTQ
jgi:hypothetical protein